MNEDTKVKIDRTELKMYVYWVESEYLKWIPVPNAKLKILKINSIKNPYFNSLFDIF